MKTSRIVLKLPLSYKAVNFYKTFNIRKILLPLDGCGGIYRVSKVCEDKAGRLVLDIERVITLLSINVKD